MSEPVWTLIIKILLVLSNVDIAGVYKYLYTNLVDKVNVSAVYY